MLIKLIDKTLHHPRTHCFSWMLSSYCNCNHFNLLLSLEDEIWNFVAYDSFSQSQFFAFKILDKSINLAKCVGRLATELDFIVVELKMVAKLQTIIICFRILVKFDG